MKRNLETAASTRKRLKSHFSHVRDTSFPEIENKLLDVNFEPYASAHPPDITIHNGAVEFKAHRKILSAISPGFEMILEGDKEASEMKLEVCDDALRILNDVIYFSKREDKESCVMQSHRARMDSLMLIAKHNVKILYELMVNYFENYFPTSGMAEWHELHEEAKFLKLNKLAKLQKRSFIQFWGEEHWRLRSLKGAQPWLVLKLIGYYDTFGSKSLGKLQKYADDTTNLEIKEAVRKIVADPNYI